MAIIGMIRAAQSGLTLREIVANIPHDAPAIVVYVMLIASVIAIWRANRARPKT